jgi:hypothetical protein
MLFRVEVLADLKARYPDMPWAERVERVSKQWAAMSQEDKAVSGASFPYDKILDAHTTYSEIGFTGLQTTNLGRVDRGLCKLQCTVSCGCAGHISISSKVNA